MDDPIDDKSNEPPEQHPANIRKTLGKNTSGITECYKINGTVYKRVVEKCDIMYKCSQSESKKTCGALIDDGANGGMAGEDTLVIEQSTSNFVDVTGIDGIEIDNIPLGTAAGKVETTSGPIILIMNNYALIGRGKTIHSVPQLLDMGNQVDSRSRKLKYNGGNQRIKTIGDYIIPLSIRNGLAYMDMTRPTQEEVDDEDIPTVIFTNEENWEPSKLDNEIDINDLDDLNELIDDHVESTDHRTSATGEYLLHNDKTDTYDNIQSIIANCNVTYTALQNPHYQPENEYKEKLNINKTRRQKAKASEEKFKKLRFVDEKSEPNSDKKYTSSTKSKINKTDTDCECLLVKR